MSKLCFFDIEANGLLDTVSLIHCLGYAVESSKVCLATDQGIHDILEMWRLGDYTLVGHNIIGYDLPALQKTRNFKHPQARVIDTMVLARFIFPDTSPEDDKLILRGKMPARLMGSHSLEAWGYRLGCFKGDYEGGWEEYTEEMGDYCKQDVEVTRKLYEHCMAQKPAQEAIELEHSVQFIIQRQVRHGVSFDEMAALRLNAEISDKLVSLERSLKETYGHFYVGKTDRETGDTKVLTPEKDSKRIGYVAGASFCPVELVEFNPGSRIHVAKVLLAAGWKPEKFTPSGAPKLSEEVLEELDAEKYPTAAKLIAYFTAKKRLGMLSDGKNGWLKLTKNGRIHGNVNTNGAVTGRMTHAAPNLAQVPSVRLDKEDNILYGEAGAWGYECRDLFRVPAGKKLVGCDASGLELRMLAHYMGRYDGGAYGHEVVNGDIHTVNQNAAGLATRKQAKTFILRIWDDLGETPRLKLCELRGPPKGTILSQAVEGRTGRVLGNTF